MLQGQTNPSFLTRLRNFLRRTAPETVTPPRPQERSSADITAERMEAADIFGAQYLRDDKQRKDLIRLSREMYRNDNRVRELVKQSADDAGGGRIVVVSESDEVQELATDIVEQLNLSARMPGILRKAFVDGDVMIEADISADRQPTIIGAYVQPDPQNFRRMSDRRDKFPDPLRAYWYSPNGTEPPQGDQKGDGVWFPAFLMIHARWDHEESDRYGNPMFAASVKPYRFLTKGEEDIATRRAMRAGTRLLHYVDGDPAAIELYKEMNRDAIDDPFAAHSDYFTNSEGGITALSMDGATIQNIGDLTHHMENMSLPAPLPLAAVGYNANVNRDILRDELEEYNEQLVNIGAWYAEQVVRPLVERHLLLNGILPEMNTLKITVEYSRKLVAAQLLAAAQAITALMATGLPVTFEMAADILKQLTGLVIDLGSAQAREARAGDVARLAAELAAAEGEIEDSSIWELIAIESKNGTNV